MLGSGLLLLGKILMTDTLPIYQISDEHLTREEAFDRRIREEAGDTLSALSIDTVQVNIGLKCNLACRHCQNPKPFPVCRTVALQHRSLSRFSRSLRDNPTEEILR